MSKFSNRLCKKLYKISLDGCDDETGSVTENGNWYGYMYFSDADLVAFAKDRDFDEIRENRHVILTEDSRGFVWYETYDGAGFDREWSEIIDHVASFYCEYS